MVVIFLWDKLFICTNLHYFLFKLFSNTVPDKVINVYRILNYVESPYIDLHTDVARKCSGSQRRQNSIYPESWKHNSIIYYKPFLTWKNKFWLNIMKYRWSYFVMTTLWISKSYLLSLLVYVESWKQIPYMEE